MSMNIGVPELIIIMVICGLMIAPIGGLVLFVWFIFKKSQKQQQHDPS